ncbi:MAG: hypothetical protein EX254_00220 [Flavobacteriaceae bacterium]|nr:hypothetical protein [Bacteroidia bacterium]NNL61098.1 hypothetical protein [Flavobacteriaceae bacterium]RZV70631.1 MAG: hypothetical protein EX254_00220 [Flavobacteriaceae bacterium]
MIKFFRKIRYELMEKNKTTKYLKYAIGEIILVMIGILLALQVNEWNNERNRKKAEQDVIEQLIADLSKSQHELEYMKRRTFGEARVRAQVLRAFWKDELPDDIRNYVWGGAGSTVYSPVLGTAQSLINSGRMDILSSKELKNDIVAYVEFVGFKLKDINRYEETYYRKGVELIREVMPGPYESKEYYNARSEAYQNTSQYRENLNGRPAVIDKVPFQTNLERLFENQKFSNAYSNLYLYHRNTGFKYEDILDDTNALLVKLYKASNKYSDLGEQLDNSEHYLVFEPVDLEILKRADALLSDASKWNKNDDRECNDDNTNESYSLHCALVKASKEVIGEWDYEPYRPAIRMVLFTLKKYENRRVVERIFQDWNNHPDSTFEELKQVLKESMDAVEMQLNGVNVKAE